MALFQKSVLNKYLKTLDDKKVKAAYQKFTDFFHNPTIIQNIREDKEEQFQYGFLQKLFDEILDYTINPNIDFNLSTEFKNLRGAKKADGAILKDGKAVGVIELKSTKTKELSKITDQAFGYKNNHPTCVYVITSNFEKLRFYINDAVDYLDFDLFTLKEEDFKLLYLCLQKDNILNDLPQRIKRDSTLQEENITKKLYKDYSAFKNALFDDLVKNNTQHSKLILFKKSQKLIDRFLFIFFAEDKGLLPPNSISKIVKSYEALEDLDNYKPLYEVFQQYFGYINSGRPARKGKSEIFAFNGGLFAPDEMLDGLKITDNILINHTLLLSGYDFDSEVDVNILGHIFEHSLNEIDEMTAELEGQTIDKNKTKRKKDGVFYTPKYITKYIVDNTVGKLCETYKEKIKLQEDDFRPKRNKETKKRLLADLEAYRAYLLDLTICDPACGSGAFLNQALDFLITEHHYIDELQTRLLGGSIVLSDITNDILERNIYGVDINDESVEIARLSLWLRTAQKGRALTTLNDNIKCGNSLIDDVEVAGNKAFDWEKEFPEIFEKGGFDVVVGNPPYVRQELIGEFKPYLEKHFKSFAGTADLFTYFYEKSIAIINESGLLSFITNDFNKTNSSTPLRAFLKGKTSFISFTDFSEVDVFKGTTTYPVILTVKKGVPSSFKYCKMVQNDVFNIEVAFQNKSNEVLQESLVDENWTFKSNIEVEIFKKISHFPTIRTTISKCYYGVKTGLNDAFITTQNLPIGENIKYYLEGKDLNKWNSKEIEKKLILFPSKSTKKLFGDLDEDSAFRKMESHYYESMNILKSFEEKAKKRYDKGDYWWELRNCAYYELFEKPKIVFPNLQNANKFSFDDSGRYINAPAVILPTSDKALLAIINSKIVWYFLTQICVVRSGGYIEVKPQYFEQIPIPDYSKESETLTNYSNTQIEKTSTLQGIISKLLRTIQRKFEIEKLSKNLQNWHNLTYAEFVKELKKKKVKLGLAEESEWEEYFETEKAKAVDIQAVIDKTDKEIDRMVYELYGLSEEEIGIVEGA
jgi:type I restriction-modification system DNA methylase subunit